MMEVKRRTVRSLVNKLSSVSEQTQIEAICELRLMSKHDPESRSLIAESGVLPILTETLFSSSPTAQENAVATLLNLSISNRDLLMSTRGLLDALSHLLRLPSATPSSLQTASATLYSLLVVDQYRPIIGAKRDIVFALIDIIKNPNSPPRSIKDALKALFGISLYPLNRATMIDLGVVPALFALVVKDGRIGIVEDATAVIAQVAGCYESGDAFKKVSGIGVLMDLLDLSTGSSCRARENSVSGLLNLIQSGDEMVTEEVRKNCSSAALDGISDIAEDGSLKAKSKATSLLKILDGGEGIQDIHVREI
ncbi:Armadillo [Macleaya cordata]|uniref:Armadillo n=1 Tax=Macleaya cordata TaxID=56857 RepID=A0A200R775_MACCD|nr:Armadillo [Macleaya cordata]